MRVLTLEPESHTARARVRRSSWFAPCTPGLSTTGRKSQRPSRWHATAISAHLGLPAGQTARRLGWCWFELFLYHINRQRTVHALKRPQRHLRMSGMLPRWRGIRSVLWLCMIKPKPIEDRNRMHRSTSARQHGTSAPTAGRGLDWRGRGSSSCARIALTLRRASLRHQFTRRSTLSTLPDCGHRKQRASLPSGVLLHCP